MILHVTPTGKSSLCIVPDGFEKQSSQHLRAEFAASASLGYITKEPFIGLLKGHLPFLVLLFSELHFSFSMDQSYFQSIFE